MGCVSSRSAKAVDWTRRIQMAIYSNHLEAIQKIVEEEGHVLDQTIDKDDGSYPIHFAARWGNVETLKYIIEHRGHNVNVQDIHGRTPLHYATKYQNQNAIDFLIQNGASLDVVSIWGEKPIQYALGDEDGDTKILNHLITNYNCDIEAADGYGITLLQKAAEKGYTDAVKLLISNGACLEVKDKNGNTPMSLASEKGHPETYQVLVDAAKKKINSVEPAFSKETLDDANLMIEKHEPDENVVIDKHEDVGKEENWIDEKQNQENEIENIETVEHKNNEEPIIENLKKEVTEKLLVDAANKKINSVEPAFGKETLNNADAMIEKHNHKDNASIKIEINETCSNGCSKASSFQMFCQPCIEHATNNFNEFSVLGKGGYGTVFKGNLYNKVVAVKRLNAESNQGDLEFIREITVLEQMAHPNLVKLEGACLNLRSLVYEFLPKGSLEDCLKRTPQALTWKIRVRIIHEICSVLIYMHSKKPSLVHGDLKPDNVLLDDMFVSKLADFGLCRFLPEGDTFYVTNAKGTKGYIDPYFVNTEKMAASCDVYSLGIMMLRLLTGKDVRGTFILTEDKEEFGFREMVFKERKSGNLMKIVDSTAGNWSFNAAETLAYCGLQCTRPRREKRIKLVEVIELLDKILNK